MFGQPQIPKFPTPAEQSQKALERFLKSAQASTPEGMRVEIIVPLGNGESMQAEEFVAASGQFIRVHGFTGAVLCASVMLAFERILFHLSRR